MVVNLLDELKEALKAHGITFNKIYYIANAEGQIPIADFVTAASNINYDNECPEGQPPKIDPKLMVVSVHWWLKRGRVDGKEGWVYHRHPRRPEMMLSKPSLKNLTLQDFPKQRLAKDDPPMPKRSAVDYGY